MKNEIVEHVSIHDLVRIVRGASVKILDVKKNAVLDVKEKTDNSPVTAADFAANAYILKELSALNPDVPTISEEQTKAMVVSSKRYWLIDPLDGTREFVKGSIEYTVNIALIKDEAPVFGIIAVPETGEVYYGGVECPATAMNESGFSQPINAREFNLANARCLISSSHKTNEESLCREIFSNLKVENVGSSLKYCYIASGRSDFSFRKGPTSIWDTAAAHAILRAAGGEMYGPSGKPLVYNPKHLINPAFIAVGDPSSDWKRLINAL